MTEAVTVDVENGVATLTLNRPDQRNALSVEMTGALLDAIDDLEGHEEARCLVITGRGKTFCAGGDIDAMAERMAGEVSLAESVRHIQQDTSRAIRRVREFHLPTVAKLDGVAYGAGANLAIACDCVVASEDARISFGFRQVGLAVDSGTSYLLPRVVGENVAKELVFTGELLDAERAADLGIFNHVYPTDSFEDEADSFVERIASGPTVALETSKRLVNQGLESSFKEAVDDEASAQAAVFETGDHREGANAFMEGREPEFEGH